LLDHQIKETPGITGQSNSSVHSDNSACYLDVDSLQPCSVVGAKGLTVR